MRSPGYRVRIIGGQWRGRRLDFPDVPGLRPTPDRVRETLFNWLSPVIAGSRCLDLFAGSGALGLEAASRGASDVTLLDTNSTVVSVLRQHLEAIKAENVEVLQQDALQYISQARRTYDIIFLDPPFRQGLLRPCLEAIADAALLNAGAYLYIETEATLAEEEFLPWLPRDCTPLRRKRAGQVNYYLVHSDAGGA